MNNGINEDLEYSPDIPLPNCYVEFLYPTLDEENGFEYQGPAGHNDEEFGLEEDATGHFALQGEVEDDGPFDLF
ncbi:hypothetical protein E2P81_ATG01667 [Venturia nashicola]|uniref:Uncharacterized protein n=1 Tax=Venturia nashicola TaxID=86259 RepID=A0A4Z1NS24_9PEZI|nr:hypothetical protein E6O75_ATG01708 [Venturia nashicola]TLD18939.1 hypothetical protein E2P81_ATG01667 [Venturia nashicola]